MKKMIYIAAILTVAAILYFYIDNNRLTEDDSMANTAKAEKPQLESEQSQLNQRTNGSPPVPIDFQKLKDQHFAFSRCRDMPDWFYIRRWVTPVSEMTERQLAAYGRLEQMCFSWYDYLGKLSPEAVAETKKEIGRQEERRNFGDIFAEEADPQFIERNIKAIANGINVDRDDRSLTDNRLTYLLHFDEDLRSKMIQELKRETGKKLSPPFLGYLHSFAGSAGIATLTSCRYYDCGPNSAYMIENCLSHDEACGLSLQEDLQRITTYGQYTDWQNAADILYRLIESGWFAERETVNP